MDMLVVNEVGGTQTPIESEPHDEQTSHEPEPENKFQKAISSWRGMIPCASLRQSLTLLDIDLSRLIPTLDRSAAELVSQQKETLIQRKEVAQKTKDFRKLDDATKLIEIKTLLKGEETRPIAPTRTQADHASLSNFCRPTYN